jgi:hypothetical protein
MHLEHYFFLSTNFINFRKNKKLGLFWLSSANMTNFAKFLEKKKAKKKKKQKNPDLELASQKVLGFYILVPIFAFLFVKILI